MRKTRTLELLVSEDRLKFSTFFSLENTQASNYRSNKTRKDTSTRALSTYVPILYLILYLIHWELPVDRPSPLRESPGDVRHATEPLTS